MSRLLEAQYTVSTPGWRDTIAAEIARRAESAKDQLADPARPRGEDAPTDDTLRGYIQALKWVLLYPDRITSAIKTSEAPTVTEEPEEEPVGSIHAPDTSEPTSESEQ